MNADASLSETIERSCLHLEATAKDFGVTLVREMGAVKSLEEIIVALQEIGAEEDVLRGATFMVGIYLGEILRKKNGGEWSSSRDGDLMLTINDRTYAPISKARKFASNPEGANSLVFFANTINAGGDG